MNNIWKYLDADILTDLWNFWREILEWAVTHFECFFFFTSLKQTLFSLEFIALCLIRVYIQQSQIPDTLPAYI